MIKRSPKIDRRQVRIRNKLHHLLDLFRQRGQLSKIEAKQRSGYSMSTVLALFDRLLRSGLIAPAQVEDRRRARGPKRILYHLDPLRRVYVGLTFTQSGIYSAIVSFSGQVLHTRSEELDITGGQRQFLSRLRDHLERLVRENSAMLSQLACVGVSLPGEIDKERGVLRAYGFMPYLKDVDFRALVAGHFPDVPIQFEQNIAGFLSCLLMDDGVVREHPLILFVSLRSGLANGVIHEGRVVTATGEIAHTQVTDAPDRCVCGRNGCLDIYLSHKALSDAILRSAECCVLSAESSRNSALSTQHSALHAHRSGYLTIPQIVAAYRSGATSLRALIDGRFRLLARAIVNAANLLAPDLIVLSGELFECFEDPAGALRRLAGESRAGGHYIHRFAAAQLIYRAMGTEASAIGLCYSRIKSDFAYQLEES
jgi:predicted NBD/HSP70 family sugar kinase